MITLHFHLLPQYKYELFHIYYTSLHCTGRYELNKLTSLPTCGFIAQLVEHRTGIAEVMGSNPVEALIFFQASSFQLLKLENLLRWSLFTFIYYRSTNMNYFIYTTQSILFSIHFVFVASRFVAILETWNSILINVLKLWCCQAYLILPTNWISSHKAF